ncbi:MAG: hypothetical protein AABX40_01955 [Candidatus Hydrothermarchaeota archaeon]
MDSARKKEVLEKVKAQIMNVGGIVGAVELNKEQRGTVARLEEKAMGNVLGGMGRGINEGVTESLSREITMVLFTDTHFDIPRDEKAMELINRGEIVGKAITDLGAIERYKRDDGYVVLSDFLVIKRDAKIDSGSFARGDSYFLFNGTHIAHFSNIPEITDHVVSLPSPPVFDFLKEEFKDIMDRDNPQLGGIIVGFNLQE